jgi:hypothetical protein
MENTRIYTDVEKAVLNEVMIEEMRRKIAFLKKNPNVLLQMMQEKQQRVREIHERLKAEKLSKSK